MNTIKIEVTYEEKASRWELLWRMFWQILCAVPLLILLIPTIAAAILQFLYILLWGKRNAQLNRMIINWTIYLMQITLYKNWCTDERPSLFPEYW